MQKNNTVTVEADDSKSLARQNTELVRIEESIEDFISIMLPSIPGTKLQICPLWSDNRGRSYYRCKFWKYNYEGIITTRQEVSASFVSVETVNGKRVLHDLTVKKGSL